MKKKFKIRPKNLQKLILILGLAIASQAVEAEDGFSQYSETLNLLSVKDRVDENNFEFGVRIIAETDIGLGSFLILINDLRNRPHEGVIEVKTLAEDSKNGIAINRRSLHDEEVEKILNIIERHELLYLPETFTPLSTSFFQSQKYIYIEIYNDPLKLGNRLKRSLFQTNSAEILKDWVVEIAGSPNSNWEVLPPEPVKSRSK